MVREIPAAGRRQAQKKLGPAWTQRGRTPAGYFTKRTAQAWLDETLAEARRGELGGMVRTGVTFAQAAEEWLRYVEQERACKPSTVKDYRNMTRVLGEPFADEPIEDITTEAIERWKADFTRARKPSNRTLQKFLVTLHGIFKRAARVYGLPRNPVAQVERPRLPRRAGIDVFAREEVMALVRAAANEQDGVLYLTAAFTACGSGSCWHCAGRTSTSRQTRSACAATGRPAGREHRRAGGGEQCR